jgi:hypothetical protein
MVIKPALKGRAYYRAAETPVNGRPDRAAGPLPQQKPRGQGKRFSDRMGEIKKVLVGGPK